MPKTLPYGREVLLTGRLVRRTFPGPPGFESVAKGDRAERVPVLELDHEVHVRHPDFPREDPHTVRRIQLWTARSDLKEEAALDKLVASAVGQKVVVKATLSVGMTGHHHTPVMGHIQQLKPKGSPAFPALDRSSPEELAAAEAQEADRLERMLKDNPPAEFGPDAQFYRDTRLRGTLVERRVRPSSSQDGWIKDGTKICWILQLDQPITISERPEHQLSGGNLRRINAREVAITFGYGDALVKRDLRSLGIEAPIPWQGAGQPLFGKHYEVIGRLSPNFDFETACADAQLRLSRIYPPAVD
ncbi:MAG TPA: hypothetical protein VK993_09970 [Chthoniobacterales bacterium]|nr:hypothetical protein [Chthoniobacterales bacterium]